MAMMPQQNRQPLVPGTRLLPSGRILPKYDGTLRCFYCGESGHKAVHCDQNPDWCGEKSALCVVHNRTRSMSLLRPYHGNGKAGEMRCQPHAPCFHEDKGGAEAVMDVTSDGGSVTNGSTTTMPSFASTTAAMTNNSSVDFSKLLLVEGIVGHRAIDAVAGEDDVSAFDDAFLATLVRDLPSSVDDEHDENDVSSAASN
eukprot:PhM_4_TR14657/c2_g1_i2/m.90940